MFDNKDIDLIINLFQKAKTEGLPCQKNGSSLDLHGNCKYTCFLSIQMTWNFYGLGKFYVDNLMLCSFLKKAIYSFLENEESLRKKGII